MKVLILDAYNLIHRARSGFTKGENAIVFNFFRGIKPLLEKFNPDKCYFVLEGYPKHRYEKIKTYKAGRPKQDDSFKRQKNLIKEIIQKYTSLIVAHHPDFECDDVAYTIAKHHCIMGDEVTLVSSDSDFIQMLQEMNIKIFHPIKKKFLSPPEYSYIEWKSLCGDKTDNISGIPGVGPKTAEKLVKSKELFESKIINNKKNYKIYETNLNVIKLIDVDFSRIALSKSLYDSDAVFKKFSDMKFSSMIKNSYKSAFDKAFDF